MCREQKPFLGIKSMITIQRKGWRKRGRGHYQQMCSRAFLRHQGRDFLGWKSPLVSQQNECIETHPGRRLGNIRAHWGPRGDHTDSYKLSGGRGGVGEYITYKRSHIRMLLGFSLGLDTFNRLKENASHLLTLHSDKTPLRWEGGVLPIYSFSVVMVSLRDSRISSSPQPLASTNILGIYFILGETVSEHVFYGVMEFNAHRHRTCSVLTSVKSCLCFICIPLL